MSLCFKGLIEINKRQIEVEIMNAYKAHKAVDVPVLMHSCNIAAHYRLRTATTLQRIHPEVVVATTNKQ